MIPATLPPNPLAAAARAGSWAEVRTITERMSAPMAAEVALLAARAHERLGESQRGLSVLLAALPGAGDLAPAVRLAAARLQLAAGEDPWPLLADLWRSRSRRDHRRAALGILQESWETLPIATLHSHSRESLPTSLKRVLAAALAQRTGDVAGGIRVLRERPDDAPAMRTAGWLGSKSEHTPAVRLLIGEALLLGGMWREAERVLAGDLSPPPARLLSHWCYVRGRVAYRLGKLEDAGRHFDRALSSSTDPEERFAAAVQRARVAELRGETKSALALWDVARTALPDRIEGWDGGARARAALGRGAEAVSLLLRGPPAARKVGGPRLAAALLALAETALAGRLLARLPSRHAPVRALKVALALQQRELATARREATSVLADRGAGGWHELVLSLLPPGERPVSSPPPTRSLRTLAELAVRSGRATARRALALDLARDPSWARLLAGAVEEPRGWSGPAERLVSVGLDLEAAHLYPHRFPSKTPAEMAWSARALAAWGNGPASLTHGERLWRELGGVPAELVPDSLLPLILPSGLVELVIAAAHTTGAPAHWLVGIVRRESRFNSQVRSSAGAIGIAQIMPETATRMGATVEELRHAHRALELSGREVVRMAERFAGRLTVVAAAYNAGDPVVTSWLERLGEGPSELLFAASVPYGETAKYVLAVVEGAMLARHLE